MNITRRDALLGATAAAAVTGAIAAPLAMQAAGANTALGGDTDLLALCAEWQQLWDFGRPLWTECKHVIPLSAA